MTVFHGASSLAVVLLFLCRANARLLEQIAAHAVSTSVVLAGLYCVFSSAVKNQAKDTLVATDLKSLEFPKVYADDIVAAYSSK